MRKLYIFIKVCFFVFLFFAVLGAGGAYYLFSHFTKDLPKLDSLKDYTPPVISEVFADDGTKVGEFWTERRIVLSPQEIPKIIEQAIVASEDDRFFEHSGIDYVGIIRASIENLRAGQIVQGGSTITQQVVKTFLLTSDRKWERKIKEAVLAKRLEDKFTKREILYLYLNQIHFGNRAYGIEAAAQNYFHKHAKELNIAEAAMLAGLPKAPSSFSPIHNYKRAKIRQEYVIDRMFEEGFISTTQRDQSKRIPLKIFRAPTVKAYNARVAPWFVEEIRRHVVEKYGNKAVYNHGLKIYTTLDLKAQNSADQAVMRGLSELHKRHGYLGPVKTIPQSEFTRFNFKNHKKLYLQNVGPDLIHRLSDTDIQNKTTQLDPKTTYQALVTHVDAKKRQVTVQIGEHKGTIINRDYGWARKRNNRSRGYNDVIYIKNPSNTFKVGNVVEVKKVNMDRVPKKYKKLYAEGELYFSLEQTPKIEGALFAYNPHSGFVRAIVGGKNYGNSEFNRATQALRQTGSVFKPFLYASAIDKGYANDTIVDDAPLKIPDGPGRFWEPKNYGGDYKGPITFHSALVGSKNLVSVRLILDVGVDYVTALVRKLGIDSKIYKVYAMSLGSNEMRLSDVTRAFGIFPTGGILPEYVTIKKMTNRFGVTLEENRPKVTKTFQKQIQDGDHQQMSFADSTASDPDNLRKDLWTEAQRWIKRDDLKLTPLEEILLYGKHLPEGYVMNPRTAHTMTNIMQDIVRYGTGYQVNALRRPAAGKTGTTNDQTDCWFVGFIPDHVAGVWVGYDQNIHKVGGGETGGKAAAPIFLYYMQEYLKGTPVAKFKTPREIGLAELRPPVDVMPGDLKHLLPEYEATGGADFFADDI